MIKHTEGLDSVFEENLICDSGQDLHYADISTHFIIHSEDGLVGDDY